MNNHNFFNEKYKLIVLCVDCLFCCCCSLMEELGLLLEQRVIVDLTLEKFLVKTNSRLYSLGSKSLCPKRVPSWTKKR